MPHVRLRRRTARTRHNRQQGSPGLPAPAPTTSHPSTAGVVRGPLPARRVSPSNAETTSPALAKRSSGPAGETPQNRRLPKRIHVRHVDTRARRRLMQAFDRHLHRVSPPQRANARSPSRRARRRARRRPPRASPGRPRPARAPCMPACPISHPPSTATTRAWCSRSSAPRHARPKSVTTTRISSSARGRLHEHDVVALEVPVHDPDAVRGREAVGHLTDDREGLRRGEPSISPELVGERLAVQQLHREEHDLAGFVAPVAAAYRWRKTS